MDQRPHVRAKTKILRRKLGENLYDIVFGNDFLAVTPKAQAMEEKKNKITWTSSKLKTCVYQRTL